MREGYYGKEPFDARLSVLRLLFKAPLLIAIICICTLLLGGGYYVKNVMCAGPDRYEVKCLYLVTYSDPNWCEGGKYINETTWNDWVNAQYFKEQIMYYYSDEEIGADHINGLEMTDYEQDCSKYHGEIHVQVGSDLRMPLVCVVSENPDFSFRVSKILELVLPDYMCREMPNDISLMEVVSPDQEASLVKADVRVKRAFILAAVVSTLLVLTIFLLREWGDDSIWVSSTLFRRYGLKTVYRNKHSMKKTDSLYYFKDCQSVAVLPVDDKADVKAAIDFMKQLEKNGSDTKKPQEGQEDTNRMGHKVITWIELEEAGAENASYQKAREADGLLLVVPMGRHAGSKLEEMLDILRMQDLKVTAVVPDRINERLENLYRG